MNEPPALCGGPGNGSKLVTDGKGRARVAIAAGHLDVAADLLTRGNRFPSRAMSRWRGQTAQGRTRKASEHSLRSGDADVQKPPARRRYGVLVPSRPRRSQPTVETGPVGLRNPADDRSREVLVGLTGPAMQRRRFRGFERESLGWDRGRLIAAACAASPPPTREPDSRQIRSKASARHVPVLHPSSQRLGGFDAFSGGKPEFGGACSSGVLLPPKARAPQRRDQDVVAGKCMIGRNQRT